MGIQSIIDRENEKRLQSLNRCTGRSTRQIDNYIQELFTKGIIEVHDHAEIINRSTSVLLYETIIKRLKSEHHRVPITYNKNKLTIKIDSNFKNYDTTTTNG